METNNDCQLSSINSDGLHFAVRDDSGPKVDAVVESSGPLTATAVNACAAL